MDIKRMIEAGEPVDLKTLLDTEIKLLMGSWTDADNNLWPTGSMNNDAFNEHRRREVERATKKIKPIDKGFYA